MATLPGARGGRSRSRLIGFAALAGFAVAFWVALTATSGLPGTPRKSLKLTFDNIGSLRKDDDVRIADVRVGHVTAIKLVDGTPQVSVALDGNRKVYKDATAVVAQRSALGQNYVRLNPGHPSSGELPSGTVIATPPSASAQDLANVLDVLDTKTRAALGTTLREIGGGALGHGSDLHAAAAALPSALSDVSTVSKALTVDGGADLTELLREANGLAQAFSGQQQHLTALSRQLSTTIAALQTQKGGPLAAAIKQAPAALTSVEAGLGALQRPLDLTKAAVTNLRPGVQALGAATPDVRGLLREAVTPLHKVPAVAAQAANPLQDLTGLVQDARPLAPHVTEAVTRAQTPVEYLAPYRYDITQFFTYFRSALSYGQPDKHFLRIYLTPGTQTVSGVLPIPDPLVFRNAYPAPGRSKYDRQTTLLGGR